MVVTIMMFCYDSISNCVMKHSACCSACLKGFQCLVFSCGVGFLCLFSVHVIRVLLALISVCMTGKPLHIPNAAMGLVNVASILTGLAETRALKTM